MVSLFNDDCLNIMPQIDDKSIDLILCDLPYGVLNKNNDGAKWDNVIPFDKLWEQYERIIKDNGAIVLFGSEPFSSNLRMSNIDYYKYDWIWHKQQGTGILHSHNMPMKDYENICVFSKGKIGHEGKVKNRMIYHPQGVQACDKIQKHGSFGMEGTQERKSQKNEIRVFKENFPRSVLFFPRDSIKLHPTQKPVALLEYLIKTYTDEGDLVLDNCMGSGSTGVAAKNLNRDFIGMELDENYFEIAKKRIEGEN